MAKGNFFLPKLAARFPSGAQLPDSHALKHRYSSDKRMQLARRLKRDEKNGGVYLHVSAGAYETGGGDEVRREVTHSSRDVAKQYRIAGNPKWGADDEREKTNCVSVRQVCAYGVHDGSPEVDWNHQVLGLYSRVVKAVFDDDGEEGTKA